MKNNRVFFAAGAVTVAFVLLGGLVHARTSSSDAPAPGDGKDGGHVVELKDKDAAAVIELDGKDGGHVVSLDTKDGGHVVSLDTKDGGHATDLR